MKPEEFGKWLESWVKGRSSGPKVQREGTIEGVICHKAPGEPKRFWLEDQKLVPDTPYNLYDDKEWLTISWGLIR
jgi:hypothetical protein